MRKCDKHRTLVHLHARIQEFSPGGGPGQFDKKSSDNVFFLFFIFIFYFFLVLSLFYRSQKVIFKEIYHFSRFQRGSNIFQGGGGSNFFQGGSNCLFPIETHITCDFPGGVRTPCHPLWIHTWLRRTCMYARVGVDYM